MVFDHLEVLDWLDASSAKDPEFWLHGYDAVQSLSGHVIQLPGNLDWLIYAS